RRPNARRRGRGRALRLAARAAARRERRRRAMKTILFACVQNAGRSQMAAAFFNAGADPARARAISAATRPAASVHAEVVEAMLELGIDLRAERPRRLTPELARDGDFLITMGCGEECPVVPGARREDWPISDPKGASRERVREIRDLLRARVEAWARAEGWSRREA